MGLAYTFLKMDHPYLHKKITLKSSTQKPKIEMKPKWIGMVFGWSIFKNVYANPILYPKYQFYLVFKETSNFSNSGQLG
jgi:hypothetical protein